MQDASYAWRRIASSSEPLTLVVFTSATCGVCLQHRTMEEAILARAQHRGIAVVVVVAPTGEHGALAREYRSKMVRALRVAPGSVGVTRVPGFFVVDRTNRILAHWVGSVPGDERERFLEALLAGSPLPHYPRITEFAFNKVVERRVLLQMLALDTTQAKSVGQMTYVTIPPEELFVRANYEPRRDLPIYVDCRTGRSPRQCQDAAFDLAVMQFTDVIVIDLPRNTTAGRN